MVTSFLPFSIIVILLHILLGDNVSTQFTVWFQIFLVLLLSPLFTIFHVLFFMFFHCFSCLFFTTGTMLWPWKLFMSFFLIAFHVFFYDRDNVVALKTFHVLWAGAIFLLHQRKWPLKESGGKMVLRDWDGSAGLLYTWSLGEPSGLPFPVGVLSAFGTEAIMAWPCDPRPNPFEKQVC